MRRRTAVEARTLGLWTASWLAVLLVAGLLRMGDITVQWPVLLVPALWAAVALRPRRRERRASLARRTSPELRDLSSPVRTDTVERPFLRERPDRGRERR